MKEIKSVEEIQNIIFDMLISFSDYCTKNNIKYSLSGGTLLGAVRHKGFIPWDDDADVMVLRSDYDKLIELLKEDCYIDKYYKAYIPNFTPNYVYPAIKIVDTRTRREGVLYDKYELGVFLDVFPLDYGYDSFEECKKFVIKRMKMLICLMISCGYRHPQKSTNILVSIIRTFNNLIGRNHEYWIEKCSDFPKLPKSKYIGIFVVPTTIGNFYQADWLKEYIDLEFEGRLFPCFKGYDNILTSLYGDYMKLPPENKRGSLHYNKIYMTDDLFNSLKERKIISNDR